MATGPQKEPFVPKTDRPEVKIPEPDVPISQLTVRDLQAILGGSIAKKLEAAKEIIKDTAKEKEIKVEVKDKNDFKDNKDHKNETKDHKDQKNEVKDHKDQKNEVKDNKDHKNEAKDHKDHKNETKDHKDLKLEKFEIKHEGKDLIIKEKIEAKIESPEKPIGDNIPGPGPVESSSGISQIAETIAGLTRRVDQLADQVAALQKGK